ncbi:MAG: addiction module toxin RelE [Ignavibacteriales bacterium]|nr:addiction module toxin RelE [Ignavibacteriales bacterium]
MNVRVAVTKNFKREAKRFLKKFASLKRELFELKEKLMLNPPLGTSLGLNAFKIRLAVQSKGKGKSGGLRVITFLDTEIIGIVEQETNKVTKVYLLSIYDKSEIETLTQKELRELIENIEEV